jgi:hypothetical protein
MECLGCASEITERPLVVHGVRYPMHFHGRECWNAYAASVQPKPRGFWEILTEAAVEKENVSISGNEPELSTEEYMMLFNRAVMEGEELSYHLPAVKDLTPEELVDHVNLINKFAIRIRVAKQAVKKTLEERRITLDKEQREALRLRDMQYKPKPVATEGEAPRKRRAAGTAKKEDLIESMARLFGITPEQAAKRLAKQKAAADSEEEGQS